MTQKELRNLLVQELYAYLGGPKVVLSDQVMPEAEYPYLYYQSIQQHIPGPANLFNEGEPGADAFTQRRSEEAQASFSFTACSLDRDGPDGHRISGAGGQGPGLLPVRRAAQPGRPGRGSDPGGEHPEPKRLRCG